ncbi:hypothetical protein SCHPADRAFT_835366, partial [Schizopora paradoxa]
MNTAQKKTSASSSNNARPSSYIPRPPNAFILFRASFVRAHSANSANNSIGSTSLSKLAGQAWRALPASEREVWERKALAAQAEHRKKYPDWRFRP